MVVVITGELQDSPGPGPRTGRLRSALSLFGDTKPLEPRLPELVLVLDTEPCLV